MKPEPLCLCLHYFASKKAGKLAEKDAGKRADEGPPGIDDYFTDAAKKRNIPMDAFETFEFQLNSLILGEPEKPAVRDLLDEVARIKGVPAKKDSLAEMWSSGDVDAMDKWNRELAEFDPGWARHLIFDRNSRMADKIEKYLQGDKTVFVVVGCLHFVGDRGIVQLLRDDNVEVQQSPATKSDKSK
jgi:uncharacterized protein YbaP (TraB family)